MWFYHLVPTVDASKLGQKTIYTCTKVTNCLMFMIHPSSNYMLFQDVLPDPCVSAALSARTADGRTDGRARILGDGVGGGGIGDIAVVRHYD